jgi:hypothetical protein
VSHGVAARMLCAVILGTTLADARKGETPQDTIFRIVEGRVEIVE